MNLSEAFKLQATSPMFFHKQKGSLVIFSYHYIDPSVFASHPETRELRGIVFSKETGQIVARPFPKFFNLGESSCSVDAESVVSANEKLDGSLVTAFVHEGNVVLASKGSFESSIVEIAQKLLSENYVSLIKRLYSQGHTTIFELLDKDNPIVISYPNSKLVLVGARDNENGEFFLPQQIRLLGKYFGVPYAELLFEDIKISDLAPKIKGLEGKEGVVAYASSHEIAKIKSDWYFKLHKFNTIALTEKRVWEAFFDQTIDDIYSQLPPELKLRIDETLTKINKRIKKRTVEVKEALENADKSSRKAFALSIAKYPKHLRDPCFKAYDGTTVEEAVFQNMKNRVAELEES